MGQLSGLSLFTAKSDLNMHTASREESEVSFSISESVTGLNLSISPRLTGINTDSQLLLVSQRRISILLDTTVIVQTVISEPFRKIEGHESANLLLRFLPIESDQSFPFSAFDETIRKQAISILFSTPESYSPDTYQRIMINSDAPTEDVNCFTLKKGEYIVLMGVETHHTAGIDFTLTQLKMFLAESIELKPNIISVDRELIPHIDFTHNDRTLDYGVSCSEQLELDPESLYQFVPERELLGGDNIFSHRYLKNPFDYRWNTILQESDQILPYDELDGYYSDSGEPAEALKGWQKRYLNVQKQTIYSYKNGVWVPDSARLFRIFQFKDDPGKQYYLDGTDSADGLIEYGSDLDTLEKRFKYRKSGTPTPYSFVYGRLTDPKSLYKYNLPDGEIIPEKLTLFVAAPEDIFNLSATFEVRDLNGKLVFSQGLVSKFTMRSDYEGIIPLGLPVQPLEYSLSDQFPVLPKIAKLLENKVEVSSSVVFQWGGASSWDVHHKGMFYLYFCPIIGRNVVEV